MPDEPASEQRGHAGDRGAGDRDAGRATADPVWRVLAPAKINPRLDVLFRRADGFHEIETFMVAIDLCDRLEVRATRDGRVRLDLDGPEASADIPCDERNLAWRAGALVLELARARGLSAQDRGLALRLSKHIPSQSGLGGASSDAAAAWLGACAALNVAFAAPDAERALAALGSDAVFFAAASATGAAWCTGRGEIVAPRSAPRSWSVALVVPEVACPTARIYAQLGIPLRGETAVSSLPKVDFSSTSAHDARAHLANRLEATALAAIPGLGPWRVLLDQAECGHFCLSGSGSAYFGLYEGDEQARIALDRITKAARLSGLSSRFCDVVHSTGHGARLLPNG